MKWIKEIEYPKDRKPLDAFLKSLPGMWSHKLWRLKPKAPFLAALILATFIILPVFKVMHAEYMSRHIIITDENLMPQIEEWSRGVETIHVLQVLLMYLLFYRLLNMRYKHEVPVSKLRGRK